MKALLSLGPYIGKAGQSINRKRRGIVGMPAPIARHGNRGFAKFGERRALRVTRVLEIEHIYDRKDQPQFFNELFGPVTGSKALE